MHNLFSTFEFQKYVTVYPKSCIIYSLQNLFNFRIFCFFFELNKKDQIISTGFFDSVRHLFTSYAQFVPLFEYLYKQLRYELRIS